MTTDETSAVRDRTVLAREIARRRTFAIISHPDAGKTTLTEKLLLYGGAIETAGAVRGRKTQRHATSDWMAMEQSRGISITSTALQFEYEGHCFNLLDTPGHQDFSEDTYRTLHATDSAVMVLDAAKGIEPQTRKLFHVCRMRRIPILGFINKMDHPGKEPLELLEEIEKELGVAAIPMNWPIGDGPNFQGVYDLREKRVHRFERTAHGSSRAVVRVAGIDDPALEEMIGTKARDELREAADLLRGAGSEWDLDRFLAGDLIPVYFGSAINNFGVEPFLRAILELAPPPRPRATANGSIAPDRPEFSAFVFKIQANMDPRHRDRLAFVRIVSGTFEKDMEVFHQRLNRKIRMTRPHRLFARERETVEAAFAGDVIGFINPGLFRIGDSLAEGEKMEFEPIPRFAPEHFGTLRTKTSERQKQFQKGIEQLVEEGAVQLFHGLDGRKSEPIIAVVGELQFDVLRSRLESEYSVETTLQRLPYRFARWLSGTEQKIDPVRQPGNSRRVIDLDQQPVMLFSSDWELETVQKENPDVRFLESSLG